jgi:glutathione S-transferase
MKLYYHPLSTYSQKTLIAFYEKNVAFEPVVVDLFSAEGRAAYEKVYPLGKIPLLKPSDDYMIPESTIIIEYLEGHYPKQGTKLIPDGVDAARQVRFIDRVSDLYLNDPVVTLLFEAIGMRKCDEATLATARKQLHFNFEKLDERLAKQEWVCGAEFTMADCAMIPPLYYCQNVAPLTDYAHLQRYFERAKQRPSYVRVMAEFVPIWQAMQTPKR